MASQNLRKVRELFLFERTHPPYVLRKRSLGRLVRAMYTFHSRPSSQLGFLLSARVGIA